MEEKIIKFRQYVDNLSEDLMNIIGMFELYVHIYNKTINKINELNIAPAFFSLTMHAFLEYSMLSLARLYKKSNSEVNLISFLNYVEQNQEMFYDENGKKRNLKSTNNLTDVIKKDKQIIYENQEKIDKLIHIRDKVLAHNDKNYYLNPRDVWAEQNFIIKDIRYLIGMAEEFLNHYTIEFSGNYNVLKAQNIYDIDNILDIITEHINREDSSI